jgi:hypothetical protein
MPSRTHPKRDSGRAMAACEAAMCRSCGARPWDAARASPSLKRSIAARSSAADVLEMAEDAHDPQAPDALQTGGLGEGDRVVGGASPLRPRPVSIFRCTPTGRSAVAAAAAAWLIDAETELDATGGGLGEAGARRVEPGDDGGVDARAAQGQRLVDVGDADAAAPPRAPRGPGARRRARSRRP